ncbi:MAG: hypothetical protein LBK83_08120 [Treponema sp.]|jgi:hypothetical protein|nr:hypothetical protein [Treponema sp.]
MANKKMMALVGLVAFITVITSCTAFELSGLEVHQTPTEGDSLGTFSTTVQIKKFWGFAAGYSVFKQHETDPAITQAIQNEIQNRGGTSAVNVKIVYKATFGQMVLNGITFTIYAPSTAIITGTIIK